jgi:hypothetical protein
MRLGHLRQTVTDLYPRGLKNDSTWRRQWCDRAGLSFSLNGLPELEIRVNINAAKVA